MKKLTLEVRPGKGFGELDFTASDQQVLDFLGEPDATEMVDDDEDRMNTILWDYVEQGFSLFFEGAQTTRLSTCETDNPETTLFGYRIFEMFEDEIIEMMKDQGYKNIDSDNEIWGEKRVSFDDALIDFYFKNDRLLSINWGVMLNEKGEVEWY